LKRNVKIVAVFLLASGLVLGFWRVVVHKSNLRPALVTPTTNVHLELSDDLVARLYRATHETFGNRTGRPKLVALTFDDGPYPIFTPMLLDELHALGVPATFFVIGRDAQQWPEITRRIVRMGNEVADHTYSHPDLDHETPAQQREEILKGRDAIWALTHDPAVRDLMRPPHGRYTQRTLEVAQKLGYSVVLWTDDSGDWRTMTPEQIERQILLHATAPDIVLMHNGKLPTIEALPAIVRHFREAGYRFVTASQLLSQVTPDELNHPLRHSL
jgi:peptidoglycan/xylan/chitin deacetylase (PgdA/CDA1 family)